MRKNYVLIDFENVQPEGLAALQHDHFEIKIFLGATQTKISFEIAQAMQTMGPRAEYIKMGGTGSNALDFHIAYYIGHLSAKDPTAYFHIISKDTGFDPLIAHLKTKKISAARETDIGEIPLVKAPPLASELPVVQPTALVKKSDARVASVIENLRAPKASKPRTVKTLSSHIKSLFPKTITEQEISNTLSDMASLKVITISDNKIAYNL